MTAEPWTLTELTDQVADALSDSAPARADGRVREVPDARTIRWYQTTGLVDRPSMRGRTALYGERHLLQLLAIKHLQGRGEPLARIQAQLAGASDDALAELAGVTPSARGGPTIDVQQPRESSSRPRFWSGVAHHDGSPHPARAAVETAGPVRRKVAAPARPDGDGATERPVDCLRLHPGVLLVIDGAWHRPDDDEVERLRTAAQPLLETLDDLELLPTPSSRLTDSSHSLDPGAVTPRRSTNPKEQA